MIINETSENVIPVFINNKEMIYEWHHYKSKYYYNCVIEESLSQPISEIYRVRSTNLRITEEEILKSYKNRFKFIRDNKLAETNFKILNNILPCNKNLFRWKKSDSNLCNICGEEESISHLLFECNYVRMLWNCVSDSLLYNANVTHDMVIFGLHLDSALNHVFSIIIYFIYREWLICSLEKKIRRNRFCYKYFVNYLKMRVSLYSKCVNSSWLMVCQKLSMLVRYIEDNML